MKLFVFFIALLPFAGWAQLPPTIRGVLYDFKSEEKIARATVSSGGNHVLTDGEGQFSLNRGDTLYISAVGYEKKWVYLRLDQDYIAVPMTPLAANLQDVVISGTLRTMHKMASPIPVESYSAKFFRKNPTPNIFEALCIVNGVQPQLNCNVCNTGDIHINGMDGPYTMVLIDGMPIVSSLSTVYGLSGIPNSMVKRIEIVKGPASTLYGSEAVGGLINIITKDPASSSRFSADINTSSFGEINADLSARLRVRKATALLGVNIFNYWTKHDVNGDGFTDVTQQRRISVFNKWDFSRANLLPASFAVRFLTEERWGGQMNWNRQWRGTDSVYGESIDTRRAELIGTFALTKELVTDYSYNYHIQDSYYGTTRYAAKQHTGFVQLKWDHSVGAHNLLAGIPFRLIRYDDNTPATGTAATNKPSLQTTSAFFLQDEWKLREGFSILGGARYEYTNLQGGVFAPRLAVKWQTGKQQTLRFSTGNGFRVVNLFTEDHAALSGARSIEIKNDLKPEKSWNANLNYTANVQVPAGYFGVDASLFYTYFTNKIVPDYISDPNKIIYDNLGGHAVSKGISANFDLIFRKGLKVLAGFTWMDVYAVAADAAGRRTVEQQMFAPRFSANYAVSYVIHKWNTTLDFTGKIYGPMRLPIVPNDFRPGYSPWFNLANLQVSRKFGARWEMYLAGKNLFNFIPKDPILRPSDPFNHRISDPADNPNGYAFDPSYSYAPMQGIKVMLGARFELK